MATQKEIALFGSYLVGNPFYNNMKVVKMPPEDIQAENVRHVCLVSRGFLYLYPMDIIVKDKLVFYNVRLWACPHCGKLYWYNEEVQRIGGDEAVMYRRQANYMKSMGYNVEEIPNESFYSVIMSEESDLMNYNTSFDTLDTQIDPYTGIAVPQSDPYGYDMGYSNNEYNDLDIFDPEGEWDISNGDGYHQGEYPQDLQPVDLNRLVNLDNQRETQQQAKKEEFNNVVSSFDQIEW